jgi:hypothetical protein
MGGSRAVADAGDAERAGAARTGARGGRSGWAVLHLPSRAWGILNRWIGTLRPRLDLSK